jgi:hypothetical protein
LLGPAGLSNVARAEGGRVTDSTPAPAVDAGLLGRFRTAGAHVEWRTAPGKAPRGQRARVAHLFQEEARVESREDADGACLTVDSGPVGALVLLLEADRRGPPRTWLSQNAGRDRAFPSGALVGVWGRAEEPPSDGTVRLADLVELARYALT